MLAVVNEFLRIHQMDDMVHEFAYGFAHNFVRYFTTYAA